MTKFADLKKLVKENTDEFVEWLDDNDWTIETKPDSRKIRFVDANGIRWPFLLAAELWVEATKKKYAAK